MSILKPTDQDEYSKIAYLPIARPTLAHSPMRDLRVRTFLVSFSFGLFSLLAIHSANSQTVSASTGTAYATATVQAPGISGSAVNDEPYALFDGLVRELRNGGYVLYMRHGTVLASTTDKRGVGAWWQDCTNSQRLAPEAQSQVRAIADAMARQQIRLYEIYTSEFCRAVDTAANFGWLAAKRSPALNDVSSLPDTRMQTVAAYADGIRILLSGTMPSKMNRLLIGHTLPAQIVHPALNYLPEGNVSIFKAEGNGRFHYLTSLSPGQWQWLGKQRVQDQTYASVAQSPAGNPQVAPAVPAALGQILIPPERELKGVFLLQALRRGGFNLYMRHGQSTVGQDGNLLQTPFWWENCAIQRNMSDSGREQARKVGAALRQLKIPVDQVLTAQFCRTRETGHLLGLGPVEVTEDINHQIGQRAGVDINAARFKRLAETPAKGMNHLLVSHTHGSPRIEERIMGGLQEGEIVVYQPDGKGGTEPVARIPLPEWEGLIEAMATIKL